MASRKVRKETTASLAPQGDAQGVATIRMWTNALETAMLSRYVGNAPTLKNLGTVVKTALRDIQKIKPLMMSDCPNHLAHQANCCCTDPDI